MNRTLRRPMFRIGGSAEGITSGLDMPKLNASRPGYNRGRVVNPGGYAGDETIGEEYKRTKAALDDIRPQRRPYWPQFATSFGLDLLTRPKSGNIFQQAAASAKGPYDKWMADRSSRYDTDDKLSAALFGDVLDIRSQRKLQKEKLESEERIAQIEADAPSGKKDFEYKGKLEDYEKLIEEGQGLANRLKELESVEPIPGVPGGPQKDEAAIAEVKDKIEKNELLQQLFRDKEEDPIRKAILEGIPNMVTTFADLVYYDQTKQIPPGLLEEKAEGGRVGYQMGGATDIPSAVPAAMPTDQGAGQDDSVQDLSFEELRARLPQEITDDIIQLIVSSKQALVEFANIRTQQDVNSFNQKYDVNLVAPQEA